MAQSPDSNNEVILSSDDLYYLADEIDELEAWYREAVKQAWNDGYAAHVPGGATIKYIYHEHTGKAPDGHIVYSLSSPGSCYRVTGHTHNQGGVYCQYLTSTNETPCTGRLIDDETKYWDSAKGEYRYGWGLKCTECNIGYTRKADTLTFGGTDGKTYGWLSTGDKCPRMVQQPYQYWSCNNTPNNTWTTGACGKTTLTIEQAIIVYNN